MIFGRRRQDEMEGFRRMREALRQQADPQEHALLEDDQDGVYEDEDEVLEDDEALADDEQLTEAGELDEYDRYAEEEAPAPLAAEAAPTASFTDATSRAAAAGPSMTTIGADTSWSGTLRSESNVYLEGRVEGTLEARDTIYVAERAVIDARLKANSVVVSGQLTGHIDCDGRLEITPTGRLSGEVQAGSLVVHEGAILDGKFKMKNGAADTDR